jgi:hypothetical protein
MNQLDLKELYRIAKQELAALTSLKDADFRLEQADFNRDEEVWEVVVSYLVESKNETPPILGSIVKTPELRRIYKKIKINKKNEIIGFYIFNN